MSLALSHVPFNRTTLMPKAKKESTARAKSPGHVFIDLSLETSQGVNTRAVASHARRFQVAGKRRQQRVSARQDAVYARSLVGWRSASATSPESLTPTTPQTRASNRESEHVEEDKVEKDAVHAPMSLGVNVGLRIDPFNAFPSTNSRSVMYMIDYRALQLRESFKQGQTG